ncbi:hypothetical protein BTE77_27955 [Ensifer adhaerens]|nr:hypothetical protein BTE77_27955 [Ensifer adhaerens]
MPYAVRSDIEEIWGGDFVADILPPDVDAEAAIASALTMASDEIDVYLSARYTLPLSKGPRVLVSPAADIAIYKLANRHTALTTTIEDRYKFAVALLQRIADGKAGLGSDEPTLSAGNADGSAGASDTAGTSSSGGAYFVANQRRFSRKSIP